jgi:hypothetical protein
MMTTLTRRRAARRTPQASLLESLESRRLMSTYYLSPSGADANPGTEGSPWRTLSKAVSTVAAGDEIVLAAGDYAGGVTFDVPNLLVRAADVSNKPVITAPINSSSVQQSLRVGVNGSGATLRGLEVVGGYYSAVKLESYWDQTTPGPEPAARDVTIEDCVMRDSGRDCVKITPDCNNVTIRRCEIYNSGLRDGTNAEGIDNVNADNFVLQDTYIHDTATNGVYVKGGAIGCVIERNHLENCGNLGIVLGYYTDAEFFDPDNTEFYYENIDGTIRNNLVVNTTYAGIGLYAALRPRVYNNTLINVATGAQAGILFAPGDVAGVTSPTRDAVLVNNVVSAAPGRTVVQVRVVDGTAAGLAGSLTMSNNRYYNPSGAPSFRDERSGFTGDLAAWQAHTGTDSASTVGDPGLDANRRPTSSSPLVNAGADLASSGGFADDLDGNARPQGAAWDIGAFEYGATAPGPTAPAAPASLTATAASATQVNLSWADASGNETGFKIERRTGSGGTWVQVGTVAANVTTYGSTGLSASTTYQFRVRAYNGAGNSAYSNTASATTSANPGPTPTAPSAPSGAAAAAASSTRVNVSWADGSNNETGFKIERRLAGGSWAQVGTVGAGVTTYADTALLASTAYEYRVRATNAAGDSAYSNVAAATTLASPGGGGGGRTYVADFGLVDGRKTKLAWTDADGTVCVAVLGGGGTAQAYVDDSGRLSIDVTGSGPKSALTIKGKGGDGRIALGDLQVSGALKAFSAKTGDLSGDAVVAGSVGKLLLGSLPGGTFTAAGSILAATVVGAVTDARLVAGVALGADGQFGGTGADADVAVTGTIRKLVLGGAVSGSDFAAGALPGSDGAYGSDDDTLAGGAGSVIKAVSAKGGVDDGSHFVAGLFGTAKIGPAKVDVTTDGRFVLLA